jgi:hypothetical protein
MNGSVGTTIAMQSKEASSANDPGNHANDERSAAQRAESPASAPSTESVREITEAQEERLRSLVAESSHPWSDGLLWRLTVDAEDWFEELAGAVTRRHFERAFQGMGFWQRWKQRGEVRAFRSQFEPFRDHIVLSALSTLLTESNARPKAPDDRALNDYVGRLILGEIEKRLPRTELTSEEIGDALHQAFYGSKSEDDGSDQSTSTRARGNESQ